MTAVIPPAAPSAPALAGGAGPVMLTVVAAGNEAAVANALASARLIEAVALARATRGTVQVMTEAGEVLLKLNGANLAIPQGARLVMQARPMDGAPAFQLMSINGRPLLPSGPAAAQAGPAPMAGGAAPQTPPAPATATPTMAPPSPGATPQPAGGIVATLLRPAQPAGTIPPAPSSSPSPLLAIPPDLAPGTRMTVRIAGVTPPPGGGMAAPTPAPGTTPTPAPGTALSPSAPGPSAAAPRPAAPPGPAAPLADPPRPVLNGTVISHGPGGQALIRTEAGQLTLPAASTLPVNSRVMLEVVGKPLPPPAAEPPPPGLSSSGWPALKDALSALANDPPAADRLLRAIPQANARLAAALSAFAGALRAGEARALLPEGTTRALERTGRRDLAERLHRDLDSLGDEASRPVGGGEWRSYTMPFLSQAEIEPIRLMVRRPPEDEDEDARRRKGGGDSRFVLEVSMSRLGRVQLDGLVWREDKRFDLIIRTQSQLPGEMKGDIIAIFADCIETMGLTGQVAFLGDGRFIELPPVPDPTNRITV